MTQFDPERVFTALADHGVGYVAVGGLAVAAHGVVRATEDVDVIPDPDPANLERLAAAINELDGAPYGEPGTAVDAALLSRDANMRFVTAAAQLDVLLADPYRRRYPELFARSELFKLGRAEIRVPSRADLILLKAGSGRDRDLLDIGDLLALDDE